MRTCKKHPTYQAKRRPTSDCKQCHAIWERKEREAGDMDVKRRMFRRGRMKV